MRFGSLTNAQTKTAFRVRLSISTSPNQSQRVCAVVRFPSLEYLVMISPSPCLASDAAVFAAFVGLDWADQKHDVMLYDQRGGEAERSQLTHTPEAIDEWACGLRQRFGGRPIAVCFEQSPTTAARRCPALSFSCGF